MDTRGMHTEPRTQGTSPTRPNLRTCWPSTSVVCIWWSSSPPHGAPSPRHHGVYTHLTWDNSQP